MNATEIDPKVLERYAKIARIAAQATGNERDAADAMRKRIEERYPGIVEALRTREIRDQTRDKLRDAVPGFDDLFDGYDDLVSGLSSDHADGSWSERAFWSAMGWAVDKLASADLRPPPPPPREPPPPPKHAKEGSHDARLRSEVEVYDAFVGEHAEHGEVIEIHFAISASLWDALYRSKTGAVKLLGYLDKQVEYDGEEGEESEESDG
jgi:hypothetical protein